MSESSAKGGSSGEEFKSAESASSLDPIAEPQFQAKFDYIKKLEKYQTDDVEPLLWQFKYAEDILNGTITPEDYKNVPLWLKLYPKE